MMAIAAEAEPYRAAFDHARRSRGPLDPEWLSALRRAALERFCALGFPTTRQEPWKYTPVAEIARTAFAPADPGLRLGPVGPTLTRLSFGGAFRGREVVFVNGVHAPDLSSFDVDGVHVLSLRDALGSEPSRLQPHLARVARDAAHPFLALNDALFTDGAVVLVRPGARVREPIHLLFLSTSGGAGASVSHPRTLLLAGEGSQLAVVESYGGPNHERYLTNAVTEVRLEAGAVLERYKLQRESREGFHVAALHVEQGKDSRLLDHSVCVGAAIARNDVEVRLAAEGGDCELLGLFVSDGQQLHDTHSRIDHAAPRCSSRELYKGVLGGRSRGVFHGRIVVRPGAQKTDAHQANRNLLLSPEALVNSTPQLEIFADDVKCKHGSTTGQLDPVQLFYLQSRGLSAEAARSLLTYAFASDLTARLAVPVARAALETFLHDRLPQAPREALS
jgi:Fe-S cluster assembly protein SufD